MWSTFLVILGVLHPLARLATSAEVHCVNPRDQEGVCINIRRCEYLLNILRTRSNEEGDFLRASVCGYEGRDPLVCCPFESDNNVDGDRGGKKEDGVNVQELLPTECGISNGSHTKIVGGNPASLGAWPWITALGYRNQDNPYAPKWLCGGSLITAAHVLTAAHCVHRRSDLFMVRVGALHLNDVNDGANPIDLLIQKKIMHPQYDPSTFTNDIAVLRLEGSVPPSLHMPICLPLPEKVRKRNYERTFPFVAGWGAIQFKGPRSTRLMEVQLPVVNLQSCKNVYDKFRVTVIDNRVLCAGYVRGGKDACEGDSGGPLMTYSDGKFYLIGVVSYGYQCAQPGIPGVYTNVLTFTDFILESLTVQ